jgi:NAD(P)-dependent dehydrogenase (short-subunit alcohol dehydrogenase family)
VRSLVKGDEAKSAIESSTGMKDVAEVWLLDMSSYESIIAFGKRVASLERLDAIVENAGVALDKWTTGDKGMETTIIVNVTGTVLLGALVMPKLQQSAKKYSLKTYISIVGSGVAHYDTARDELQKGIDAGGDILEYFNKESNGIKERYVLCDRLRKLDFSNLRNRYPVSKLLLLYAVREYASLHPVSNTGVVVNYVNPGLCQSDLTRNVAPESQKFIQDMRDKIGRSTEVGSRTLIHGAFAGDESHGKYLSECVTKDHSYHSH